MESNHSPEGHAFTERSLKPSAFPTRDLVPSRRIELRFAPYQSGALPLDDDGMAGRRGFEPQTLARPQSLANSLGCLADCAPQLAETNGIELSSRMRWAAPRTPLRAMRPTLQEWR